MTAFVFLDILGNISLILMQRLIIMNDFDITRFDWFHIFRDIRAFRKIQVIITARMIM